MMNGPVISPPPISAVQELKDLLHLIGDHKKASELLHSLEHNLKALHEVGHANNLAAEALEKSKAELVSKKLELEKVESALAAREKLVLASDASFYQRENIVAVKEKALAEKLVALDVESEALLSDLKSKQKALEKAQAEALAMKANAEQMMNQYNEKSARLQAAMGG